MLKDAVWSLKSDFGWDYGKGMQKVKSYLKNQTRHFRLSKEELRDAKRMSRKMKERKKIFEEKRKNFNGSIPNVYQVLVINIII